jgi:hypothetical protein
MSWTDDILNQLSAEESWSYRAGGSLAAEPLALAALALAGYERPEQALAACRRLTALQAADGSVGILLGEATPAWPTPLAVLAWSAAAQLVEKQQRGVLQQAAQQGVGWLLSVGGDTSVHNPDVGHDAGLRGWSWALGTHSWVEPTAMSLLALKAMGYGDHPRAREAAELLIDRLLPGGGCNYGNTTVLGQVLRPQPTSSGLALAALKGEHDAGGRIDCTIGYLQSVLNAQTTSLSLAYGLIGLAAHDRMPADAGLWLEGAAERTGREAAPYKRALLALTALGKDCPLITSSHDARVQT